MRRNEMALLHIGPKFASKGLEAHILHDSNFGDSLLVWKELVS